MEKIKPWLGEPKNTIAVLQKYGFVFQKKYGQNFLIDTHVLDKIVAAAQIGPDDFVVEIGPGIGTLTQYLAYAAREVCAVEIDKNLIPILADTLSVSLAPSSKLFGHHNMLQFEIRCQFWSSPYPLELLLKTSLDLETGQVAVSEQR